MENKRWKRANALRAGLIMMLVVFLIQTKPVSAAPAIPAQSKEFYVNDVAGIMSEEVKSYIIDHSNALHKATKAQVVVAAVDSLEEDSVENYANRMYRQYEIGDKEKNNGVLLILAVEDREVRIEVGYGLEGAINDAKAGRIIRQIGTPYLSEENWDEGIKAMYAAVMKEVYAEYNLNEPEDVQRMAGVNDSESEDSIDPFFVIMVLIVLAVIISNFKNGGGRGGRGRRYYGGYGGFGGGGFGGGFGGSGGGFGGGSFGGGGSSGGGGASGKF